MTNRYLIDMAQDPAHWKPVAQFSEHYPQFSKATLKHLFWKRDEKPGLNRCARMVGKKLYINVPMFGLYLAGALPEQQGE